MALLQVGVTGTNANKQKSAASQGLLSPMSLKNTSAPRSVSFSGPSGVTGNNANKPLSASQSITSLPNSGLIGIRATSPSANIKPPSNALPASQQSSPGSYKGTAITPGDQASLQSQMAKIDSGANMGGSAPLKLMSSSDSKPPLSLLGSPRSTGAPGSAGNPYTPNTGLYGQLITGLANRSAQASPQYDRAYADAQKANEALKTSRSNEATSLANNFMNPIPLEFQQGRGQVLQSQYLQQQAALAGEFQGATNLLGAANTQQQLQQSALQGAASLAAPQQVQYGVQYLDPSTGQPLSGTGGDFAQAMSTYAQALANNQPGVVPSSITSNPVLMAQLVQQAQAINPSFNYNTAAGAASAQQSNVQTGGTAGVQANQQVFNQAYGAYTQLQNSVGNIDQFGNLLLQTMQQGGINPSDVKYANEKLATIRGQLSNAQQAVYDNTLASLRSRVSGLLAAGGSEVPTAITADAQKILDGSLPLSALSAVLARIKQEGQVLLQNQGQIVNNAWQGIQAGAPQGSAASGGSSGAGGGGLWNW